MWNKYLSIFFWLLLLFGLTSMPVYSEESESEELTLRWESVPGALGYIIEIRNSEGRVIESKRISTNYYTINSYTPGSYQHRVGVLNKFGKLENFTEWSSFEILKSLTPVIDSNKIYAAGLDEDTIKIEVEGKNFLPDMKIYLLKEYEVLKSNREFENFSLKMKIQPIKEEKIIKPVSYQVKSNSLVVAEFDPREIESLGTYSIILENPKKKKAIASNSFIVSSTKERAERIAQRREKILRNEVPEGYYDTPYWSTLWRSALLPGWGQYYIDDAKWKLYLYPAILAGAGFIYAFEYRNFLNSRKRYYTAIERGYFLLGSSTEFPEWIFILNYQTAVTQYDSAKRKLERIRIGTGLIALFAIYNMLDAYLSVERNFADSQSTPIFSIPGSYWTFETNSELRPVSEINPINLETYTHLEFKWRF